MKFLYGYFHPQTGESVVALANRDGVYIGEAKLHQEDKEYGSELCGCRLAEMRAWVKYLLNERRRKKLMLKAIQNLNKDIQLNCNNIDPKIQRRINLKLRDYTQEISTINKDIADLKNQIVKDIKIRDDLIKRSNSNKKYT